MEGLPKLQLDDLLADPKETTSLHKQHPEKVSQLTAIRKEFIKKGGSPPGTPQKNHAGKTWWPGLPWNEGE